ncbi:MAG: formylglycine-generating enzyme family protein [Verrucomicrobiales bacterium]|nr:formylglycine-generating enzyme family protein [Verrucomicrobiales bacterium]
MKTRMENGSWKLAGSATPVRRSPSSILQLLSSLLTAFTVAATETPPDMACVSNGVFRPLFRSQSDLKEVPVKSFYLDVVPVTNGKFLEFVRANPRWQRSQVKRIFADDNYLKHWAGDLELGTNALPERPVVWVSWFAAKAFAQWQGRRLPTLAEWELAAAASPALADGTKDAAFQRDILRWYSTPSPAVLPSVSDGPKNFWGVRDLHGLVWEWVSDFNSATVTGDARGDTGLDRQLFCGAGAIGAKDVENFPAFMRYGFRSSLKAAYTVHNLGFRCAKDL